MKFEGKSLMLNKSILVRPLKIIFFRLAGKSDLAKIDHFHEL